MELLKKLFSPIKKKKEATIKFSPIKRRIKSLYKRKKREKSDGKKKGKTNKSSIKKITKKRNTDGNYQIIKKSVAPKKIKQEDKWKIYSLARCEYCLAAQQLLNDKNIDFDYIEFASLQPEEQSDILKKIDSERKGFRTYPRIFKPNKDGKSLTFVGGFNDLKQLI